jgi:hypothetical protein
MFTFNYLPTHTKLKYEITHQPVKRGYGICTVATLDNTGTGVN